MSHVADRDDQTNTIRVEPLTARDVRNTARLHREHLPHGLFPRLGERFVRRWHRTFVDDPAAIALGVRSNGGDLHGFLLATTDQHTYTRRTLGASGRALAGLGVMGLLMRPHVLVTFARTRAGRYWRRLSHRTTNTDTSTPLAPIGVLHALVCVPHSRGRGIGAALVDEYARSARQRGTERLQLVTRRDGGAAAYYRSLGWEVTDEREDRDGNPVVQLDRWLGQC